MTKYLVEIKIVFEEETLIPSTALAMQQAGDKVRGRGGNIISIQAEQIEKKE